LSFRAERSGVEKSDKIICFDRPLGCARGDGMIRRLRSGWQSKGFVVDAEFISGQSGHFCYKAPFFFLYLLFLCVERVSFPEYAILVPLNGFVMVS